MLYNSEKQHYCTSFIKKIAIEVTQTPFFFKKEMRIVIDILRIL